MKRWTATKRGPAVVTTDHAEMGTGILLGQLVSSTHTHGVVFRLMDNILLIKTAISITCQMRVTTPPDHKTSARENGAEAR